MSSGDSAPSDSAAVIATATEPMPPVVRVVGYVVEGGWTRTLVPPRSPTGTLLQLVKYHDDYGEKGVDDALFVRDEQSDS